MSFKNYQSNVSHSKVLSSFERSCQCDCGKIKDLFVIPQWIMRNIIKKCKKAPFSQLESYNRLNKITLVLSVKRNSKIAFRLSPLGKSLDLPEYYEKLLDKERAFGSHKSLFLSVHMRKRRCWAKDHKGQYVSGKVSFGQMSLGSLSCGMMSLAELSESRVLWRKRHIVACPDVWLWYGIASS